MDTHEDMVLEILLRLPVKCLIKCLSVCKGWYALIKSPSFIDLHLKNKKRTDFMIFRGRNIDGKAILSYSSLDRNSGALLNVSAPPNFPALPFMPDVLILCGPCNGIFCVVAQDGYPFEPEELIFLCNPATRESRRLPNRPLGPPPSQTHFFVRTCACGLGFDPSTNDYKVVSVFRYEEEEEEYEEEVDEEEEEDDRIVSDIYRIGIYSLRSDSWREVETALPATMRSTQDSENCDTLWYGSGFLSNRHLHWMVDRIILCFDIANEVMRHIPWPENVDKDMKFGNERLVELNDCLGLAVAATPSWANNVSCSISIWTMVDYGAKEPWMKRFSVSIPFVGARLFPISIWNDDTLLLLQLRNDELISVKLGKEEGDCRVKTQKLVDRTSETIIMLKESLVPLR